MGRSSLGYLKITPGVAGLGHRAAAFGPNPCLTRNDRSQRVLKNAMSKLLLFLSPSIGRRRASVSGKSTRAGGPEREVENENGQADHSSADRIALCIAGDH